MALGELGVWHVHQLGTHALRELEALGFSAVWLGGDPGVEDARRFLEASSELVIATGILNVWQHEPADVAARHADVSAEFPGRFLLGIGIGHREAVGEYTRPLGTMRYFFDGLDAAPTPVPKQERLAAALGPKMLDLAAERSLGTHPYFTTASHTRFARERVGPGVLVAPEVAVVLEDDADIARRIAREYASLCLGRVNYTTNLLRFDDFTEDDIANGGSDRLIDAVIPHGLPEAVAEGIRKHLDAGADHVGVQALGHGWPPLDDYRALAEVLL